MAHFHDLEMHVQCSVAYCGVVEHDVERMMVPGLPTLVLHLPAKLISLS